MKKNNLLSLIGVGAAALAFVVFDANAAIENKSTGNDSSIAMEDYDLQGMSEMEAVAVLRNDIAALDDQIADCEKKRKGWIAATVVGSAGVVGTGIGAIVQGKKVKESKATLTGLNQQLGDVKTQINEANTTLKEVK